MIIAVRPYPQGYIELEPVDSDIRELVRLSNQYDNSCIAYLENDADIDAFFERLCDEDIEQIKNGYTVTHEIDQWEFRHMVGGQSD